MADGAILKMVTSPYLSCDLSEYDEIWYMHANFDPGDGNEKISKIPKFKMVDGRHIENHFLAIAIGASAIELAGTRAPQISDSGGMGAQQNLWGTCKKLKRLMKKPKYSAKEVFSMSSLGNGHTATDQQLYNITLCFMSDSAQTAVRHRLRSSTPCIAVRKRNPESTLYFVVDWIQVLCTRVDGRKYLNTKICHRNRNLSFTS